MSIQRVKLPSVINYWFNEKTSQFVSRKSSLTIYKSFARPNLNYADIIYDKPLNKSFKKKIELVQCNAALTITGAIKGTFRDKSYQELGLKSLGDRRWSRKLIFFHKTITILPSK